MYRLLRCSLALNKGLLTSSSYLSTSRQLISTTSVLSYSSSAIETNEQKLQRASMILERCVDEKNRQVFRYIRSFEKDVIDHQIADLIKDKDHLIKDKDDLIKDKDHQIANLIKDKDHQIANLIKDKGHQIANLVKDKDLQIANKDKDLEVTKIKMGHLNMNYLRLAGAVHLRGVFEQWESLNLDTFQGDRGTKWTKYLDNHKGVLETFRNFWPNPNEIDGKRVAAEMRNFYKWLSERIHNAQAAGDEISWYRIELTPVQNKVAEYMCKDLHLRYRIVEPVEPADPEPKTNANAPPEQN